MDHKKIGLIAAGAIAVTAVTAHMLKKKSEKTTYKAEAIDAIPVREMGFYEKYIKRCMDVVCATGAIAVFSPLYLGVAVLVKLKLGSPVLFTQDRPGIIGSDGKETVFKLYKFRTMTVERDDQGELLPDEVRLTKFGKWLRSTSLDELPEAFNILNSTMSVIGPRPQLVRDMTFMTAEQRRRHTAKPGLSGLAQVNGRNGISWEDKINWDLKYIEKVSLVEDIRIIFKTVMKAFIKQEGITEGDMATAEDLGDWLLRKGEITEEEYEEKQERAKNITRKLTQEEESKGLDDVRFSVSICVYGGDNAEYFDSAIRSVVDQTVQPNEIVLTVDGPIPPQVESVIEKYKRNLSGTHIGFKVIYLEKNMGHGEARRICFDHCSYDLIALMDADDLSVPDRFERQIGFYQRNPGLSVVGGYIQEFVASPDNCVGKRIVPLDDADVKEYMTKRCPMNQVTVMFKKKDVAAVGGYIDWYCEEDYYLWIRLALAGKKFGNISENLVNVRVGEEMYDRRGGVKYFQSEARLQMLMLKKNMISLPRYIINVGERFVLQVLMPNKVRGYIFQKFARS